MRENADSGVRPAAVLILLLLTCVMLISFTGDARQNQFPRMGLGILSFTQSFLGGISGKLSGIVQSLKDMNQLREDYREAVDKLAAYRGLQRDLVELRRENAALKGQLDFANSLDIPHIPVRVIAGDPSNLFSTLVIDKGAPEGIKKNMPVMAFQDGLFGLVGKVTSTGNRTSMVRPVSDPSSYVAARISKSRYQGLVEGLGAGTDWLAMRYVPRSALGSIEIHDLVVTSGMNSFYQPDLYIGRVQEVKAQEYAASLEIIIKPIIDYSRLEYLIVLPHTPDEEVP